jgi:hypothetical protein
MRGVRKMLLVGGCGASAKQSIGRGMMAKQIKGDFREGARGLQGQVKQQRA